MAVLGGQLYDRRVPGDPAVLFGNLPMRRFGRFLQLAALILTPVAFIIPKPEVFRFPGPELTMLLACVCLFGVGRIVEGYGK